MGESYPPKGYDPLTAPKVNPSPNQSLWQAELLASATARRNMESVRSIFTQTYGPYIEKLRGRFGADITSGVLRETGMKATDSVGSPRFRKAVALLSKKADIPAGTCQGILEAILTLHTEERKVKKSEARLLRHNFKSIFSGDVPIPGQFESLRAVMKHPLDMGASSDNPVAWVMDTRMSSAIPRVIAWHNKYGLRDKNWYSPYMQYLEKHPPLQPDQDKTELLKSYKGGKYWQEFGSFMKAKPSDKTLDYNLNKHPMGVAALDHNLYLLTGTLPDATAGRVIPKNRSQVSIQSLAKPNIHEGAFLQPLVFFYAKAYGRNVATSNYWKINASYRLQALQESEFSVCYLVPVNPLTGGALAPGIPVVRVRGSPSDAILYARKYYPHVMSITEGENPNLHPDLAKQLGASGTTNFKKDWEVAPSDFRTSQRFAVVVRSTWAWPDTTLFRDKNWQVFSPNHVASTLNSEQLRMLQVSRLKSEVKGSSSPGKIPKRSSGIARSLLDGKPIPTNSHQSSIAEVYIVDQSAEIFMKNAIKEIQKYMLNAARMLEKAHPEERKFHMKGFRHAKNVAMCAFGMLNSSLWIQTGSLTGPTAIPEVESTYGVYGGFTKKQAADAHRLLSPVMAGVQTRLAMKVPINDIDDVGMVMKQFIEQYGLMPEMKVPDMIPYKIVDKTGKPWKPTSVGATLITDLQPEDKGDSDFFNKHKKAIRPCHPYHVYSLGMKVPGGQGNLTQLNNVWSTNVSRRLPLQARGLSGKMYGKNLSEKPRVQFEERNLNGFGSIDTAEGFETNNGIGLPKASMIAAVVGMLALRN